MKIIKLTAQEFYNFKQLAKFVYEYTPANGTVFVEADENELKQLGY